MGVQENDFDPEEVVSFKRGERMVYGVENYDGTELMAVIAGYDLDVSFNMRTINSLEDAEALANGIADVFYKVLMEKLIANNPHFGKQEDES